MATPYDMFKPSEYDAYSVDKILLERIYGKKIYFSGNMFKKEAVNGIILLSMYFIKAEDGWLWLQRNLKYQNIHHIFI